MWDFLNKLLGKSAPIAAPGKIMSQTISQNGLNLTKQFEGLKLAPYLDGGGVPTIGYGTTFYEDGSRVSTSDSPITQERAESLLRTKMDGFAAGILKCTTVALNQNQFDAVCDFVYNVGLHSYQGSTLLKMLNSSDFAGAADQFLRWDKDNGQVVAGLLRRREAERTLFLS